MCTRCARVWVPPLFYLGFVACACLPVELIGSFEQAATNSITVLATKNSIPSLSTPFCLFCRNADGTPKFPLGHRGDFVRFVKKHPRMFQYFQAGYEIVLLPH